MAGLTTALLVGGATLGGAALSSRASSSAARTVQQGTDRAADLQNQQFQQLLQLQMPAYDRANAAGSIYSQALGIPTQTTTAQTGTGSTNPQTNYEGGGVQGQNGFGRINPQAYLTDPRVTNAMTGTAPQANPAAGGMTGGGQLDIARQVMNTPGYQTQLDQGIKSIDRAAPLTGGMYSGRRMKALNDYGQNAFGSYYNDWMNRVGGVAGQSAQIGSNIGQQGMQNAQNVGNLMMTGANARAQGSLNSASAWTGALGGLAGMAGGYFG